jgi:putative protein kinase ArgK-like GTPase of G3E family
MKPMKTKTFDCVAMKHQGAEQLREKIDPMTDQQKLAFWFEQTQELKQRLAAAKAQKEHPGNKPSAEPSTIHQ